VSNSFPLLSSRPVDDSSQPRAELNGTVPAARRNGLRELTRLLARAAAFEAFMTVNANGKPDAVSRPARRAAAPRRRPS
jgi:hypothetical protein